MTPRQSVSQGTVQRFARHIPRPIKWHLRRYRRRFRRTFDSKWYRHTLQCEPALWVELGRLQFDFLIGQGLQPQHYLLDVGCGPLRAGVHFIRYLEPGHYYGVERDADVLGAGRDVELPLQGLADRRPVLNVMEDFSFDRLGQTFDYALAQSVFTHLPLNKVIRCLMSIERVLVSGGKFFATVYLNERGKKYLDPIEQAPGTVTHMDKNPFHYEFATFEWICEGTGLTPAYLGDWNSPRNQKMLLFTKTGDEATSG
jgi:SAM-dependent methyltransferase